MKWHIIFFCLLGFYLGQSCSSFSSEPFKTGDYIVHYQYYVDTVRFVGDSSTSSSSVMLDSIMATRLENLNADSVSIRHLFKSFHSDIYAYEEGDKFEFLVSNFLATDFDYRRIEGLFQVVNDSIFLDYQYDENQKSTAGTQLIYKITGKGEFND